MSAGNFPNDCHLLQAIYSSQWEAVLQLIAAGGASQEALDRAFWTAVRRNKWHCAREISKLDHDPDKRNVVLEEEVRNCRWEFVIDLMRRGVSAKSEQLALTEAVMRQAWSYVPGIVQHYTSTQPALFAISQCIRFCRWACVLELVKLDSGLTEKQREYVCDEAMACGHWDCVAELLKQGAVESYTRMILDKAFKLNQGAIFVSQLSEREVPVPLKYIILKTVAVCRGLGTFTGNVVVTGFKDSELSVFMLESMNEFDMDLLHLLIKCMTKGHRLFKHLCLRHTWPQEVAVFLFDGLYFMGENSLAFHVAVTQGLWDMVVLLFDGSDVTKSSRKFAIFRAMSRGEWEHVKLMTRTKPWKRLYRPLAFLEAVRRGDCKWALKLFNERVVRNDDVEAAINICISQGHWKYVSMLIKLYTDDTELERIFVDIVTKAIDAGQWQCIRRVFELIYIDTANIFRDFFRVMYFSTRFLLSILTKTNVLQKRMLWRICIPHLAQWYADSAPDDMADILEDKIQELGEATLSDMARWCSRKSFCDLAAFLAVVGENWTLALQLTEDLRGSIDRYTVQFGIERAMQQEQWELALSFLHQASTEDAHPDKIATALREKDLSLFINMCRQKGLTKWAVSIGIWTDRLDMVKEDLDRCDNQEIIAHAIRDAASGHKWTIINRLLDQSVQDERLFSEIIAMAVEWGEIETVEKLTTRVDPRSCTAFGKSLLRIAVSSYDKREELVRHLISIGVSTHQCRFEDDKKEKSGRIALAWMPERSPIHIALANGQLPLVKLLHQSGSCTNRELYRLKRDGELRSFLESQNRLDVLFYLETAASNTRTLLDLCRLSLSRMIGCHPGHRNRVRTLAVPESVQKYILFEDILE